MRVAIFDFDGVFTMIRDVLSELAHFCGMKTEEFLEIFTFSNHYKVFERALSRASGLSEEEAKEFIGMGMFKEKFDEIERKVAVEKGKEVAKKVRQYLEIEHKVWFHKTEERVKASVRELLRKGWKAYVVTARKSFLLKNLLEEVRGLALNVVSVGAPDKIWKMRELCKNAEKILVVGDCIYDMIAAQKLSQEKPLIAIFVLWNLTNPEKFRERLEEKGLLVASDLGEFESYIKRLDLLKPRRIKKLDGMVRWR